MSLGQRDFLMLIMAILWDKVPQGGNAAARAMYVWEAIEAMSDKLDTEGVE